MKRILVILYYWPPAGGGGVQRWLKFTKYLPTFGWQPIVYAPENADYPIKDSALNAQVPEDLTVIRHPVVEPRRALKGLRDTASRPQSGGIDQLFYRSLRDRTLLENMSVWIRGNVFVPDARVLWVRPSVRFLLRFLRENRVDAIVTTGPPHSVHLIGRKLKRETDLPWVADFRDPWTDIEYQDLMMMTGVTSKRHRRMERSVFEESDCVVGVSPYWEGRFKELGARRVVTITNGFDPDDFADVSVTPSESFVISHVGTLALDRDPTILWKALSECCKEDASFARDLRVELVGKTDPKVVENAGSYGLSECVVDRGYVGHEEAILTMKRAQVLLLLVNRAARNAPGRMPGKMFEYLAAGRPILLIGPTDGDAAETIRACQAGASVDFDDIDSMKRQLKAFYERYRAGDLTVSPSNYERFTRRNLAGRLAALLEEVVDSRAS